MMSLIIVLGLSRDRVYLSSEAMLGIFMVMLGCTSDSWIYVSNSVFSCGEVHGFISMVVSPDDMMVNVSLVVVSIEMAEFVSEMLFNVLNVLNGVMRDVMVSEVVLTEDVLVTFA